MPSGKPGSRPSRSALLGELLGDEPHELARVLEDWLASRRFAAFVRENLTKVRKKLRGARGEASARDLLLELTAAHGLVQDKRLAVTYEPTPGGSARGPDFAVRFTARQEVMLEVTRLRGGAGGAPAPGDTDGERAPDERGGAPAPGVTTEAPEPDDAGTVRGRGQRDTLDARRLAGVLALKLGQTVPDRANVLLVGVEGDPPGDEGLAALLDQVRRDVETTDPEALLKRGFRHRGEYLRRLARLSAVFVRRAPGLTDEPVTDVALGVWVNPQARAPLPNDVRRALVAALGGAGARSR